MSKAVLIQISPVKADLIYPDSARFILRYYRWVQSMIFAIEEINQNPNLLPNITLGYGIYDTCFLVSTALEGSMWLITGQEELIPNYRCTSHTPLAAIIGDATSGASIPMARLLGLYHYPQLFHYIKNVHFKNKVGEEIYFDAEGNSPTVYDIINWHLTPDGNLKYVEVGKVDFSLTSGKELIINSSALVWNGGHTKVPLSVCSESCPPGYRKAAREGEPICCFDCIQCSEGEISNQTDSSDCLECPHDQWSNDRRDKCIAKSIEFLSYTEILGAILASLSILASLLPASIFYTFIRYRDTPMVKANNRELSYSLLLSLVPCFLCCLIFIGQPSVATCILRQTAFGIIFVFSVSCVLAKTVMVVVAFNATKPNSNLKKWLGHKLSHTVVFVCTSVQVIICIAWLSSSPPFPEDNMKSEPGKIIIECNEGSTIAFWCMLGYMGLLAIVSFIVAFLARNLPDSFNEAKFITFSMLVFVTVWLSFIPAYLSTKGKYMVAVEIFAILASSTGLLACIFFPKCYIILLRPDINTREHLMGKGTVSKKNVK
ncbi:extracellular calcium-sensing receptor-like [Latimeria chalumnae]|uniref:extracellular calcium-sensing receptor-like n=1 Tax=Latimeria chalumnae TaxID=7897 RepID=UPI00313C4018